MIKWIAWRVGLAVGKAVKRFGYGIGDKGQRLVSWSAMALWDETWCGGSPFEGHEFTVWTPGAGTWAHTCTKCGTSEIVKQRPSDYTE